MQNSPEQYLKHKTFVIHGTVVLEQKDSEDDDQPPKESEPRIVTRKPNVYIKNIPKNFIFTEYHKKNVKNVYINLAYQTECMRFPQYQCWNGIIEFENGETVDNIHVKIDAIVTPKCKLVLCPKCIQKFQINGYKMLCKDNQHNPYLDVSTSNENEWVIPNNGIFFLLEKGNYHSSWQAGTYLDPVTIENIKTAHNVIKKFNYYEHLEKNEMLLVFTTINEVTSITNAVWYQVESIHIPKIQQFIPIHAKINTAPRLNAATQLHERIHEYINPLSLGKRHIKYENRVVFVGDKTVQLVLKDSKIDTSLRNNIIFVKESGKYGLIMQDSGHLGNWGEESAPSNYGHIIFKMGKYTMSVINEGGFYMT
jgi:hypothetical protein